MIFWNLSRNEQIIIKKMDKMTNEIKIFEGNQIRSVRDNEKEEGREIVTFCHGLKLKVSGYSSKKRDYRFRL